MKLVKFELEFAPFEKIEGAREIARVMGDRPRKVYRLLLRLLRDWRHEGAWECYDCPRRSVCEKLGVVEPFKGVQVEEILFRLDESGRANFVPVFACGRNGRARSWEEERKEVK